MRIVLLFSLLFALSTSCHSQNNLKLEANRFKNDSTLRILYDYQNKKEVDSLLVYLNHAEETYRLAAVSAFASIQDTNAIAELWRVCMKDNSSLVRQEAAFALGQIGSESAESRLIFAYSREKDALVNARVLEAIGQCASFAGCEFLADLSFDNDTLRLGQAYGLYRAASRRVTQEGVSLPIITLEGTFKISELLLLSRNEKVRKVASAYFARNRKYIKETDYKHQCRQLAQFDNDAIVRLQMTQALELHDDDTSFVALKNILEKEKDYRVLVSAFRALKAYNLEKKERAEIIKQMLEKYFEDVNTNPNILIAAAEMCENTRFKPAVEDVLVWAQLTENYRARAILWGLAAKTSEQGLMRLKETLTNSNNPYETAVTLSVMPVQQDNLDFFWAYVFDKKQAAIVKTSAMEVIQGLHSDKTFLAALNQDKVLAARCLQNLTKAVSLHDEAVSALAAAILRVEETPYKVQIGSNIGFLENAGSYFAKPKDIESYIEIAQTLAYLKGSVYKKPEAQAHSLRSWAEVVAIPVGQCVRLETTKGDVIVELLVNETPFSVANFLNLVRKGFYTNRFFHRVVQNFVAQGGCPRGDGWGGSEGVIRSEFTARRYDTGVLGLASAGKDTESCQWFFTHCPTPHLDGRYTIFGKIVIGQYVIDALEIGDRIKRIEILGE